MSNEEPVSGKCNAETRDGGHCANPPVTDAKRCRMHGGTNDQKGKNNTQHIHGGYAADLREAIPDDQRDAFDDLERSFADGDPAASKARWRESISFALMRYRLSGDPAHFRAALRANKEIDTREDDESTNPNERTSDGLEALAATIRDGE